VQLRLEDLTILKKGNIRTVLVSGKSKRSSGHPLMGFIPENLIPEQQDLDGTWDLATQTRNNASLQIELLKYHEALEELRRQYLEEYRRRQELEEQLRQRVEFERIIIHELKTPLTPLMAAGDLLLSESPPEPLISLARIICTGADRINRMIDELLDLARGETGMLKIKCRWLDPLMLLSDIIDYMAPKASENRQTFLAGIPISLRPLWADEGRLRQVILNLLDNAFKFTPRGGKITLNAREDDESLVISVCDNGCGIDEEEQKHLFEPYFQPQQGDVEHFKGLGLGLALARTLVELHGGRIWVKSQKAQGTTFGLSIPSQISREVIRASCEGSHC
jgi:signal transduction histidine kinase